MILKVELTARHCGTVKKNVDNQVRSSLSKDSRSTSTEKIIKLLSMKMDREKKEKCFSYQIFNPKKRSGVTEAYSRCTKTYLSTSIQEKPSAVRYILTWLSN